MLRYWPIILWLIYFFAPIDVIPDFIPGLGRLDDLLLLAYLYWAFLRKKPGYSTPGSGTTHGQTDYAGSADRSGQEGAGGWDGGGGSSFKGGQPPGGNGTQRGDPYTILSIQPSASLEEIKHAYRLQAARYHPDKVSHLGEEFQTLAKEKFQDIQWAYETLMKRRSSS